MKTLHTGLLLLLLWTPFAAQAENSTRLPGYTIHHNALTTDFLSPEVARQYGIQRSKGRGMLNISVIKDDGMAVTARVKVTARNLIGQHLDIPLREIREGDAIYYIGDFPVANRERLSFRIEVTPAGDSRPLQARLEHEFYTD